MPTLNADIPRFEAFIRKEFLYNGERGHGEFIPVVVFGIASIPGRAIGFHIMTNEGAQFARMPIHALAWREDAPPQTLEELELWNCFSYNVSVHEFEFLSGLRARVFLRGHSEPARGTYMFTIDWYGSPYAENPGDLGHKSAHVFRLDNGNFAAQPNNRVFWHEPSFITKPFERRPDYVTNTRTWDAENGDWQTEDSDRTFYEVRKVA